MVIFRLKQIRGLFLGATILMSLASVAAPAKTLSNKNWLQHSNLKQPIYLNIDGERLELRTNIGEVLSYYKNKPPDTVLLPDSTPPNEEPQCSQDLKENIYQLRPFDPKIALPEDLAWSENPFEDRNWEFWFHNWKFSDCLMNGYRASGDIWYMERLKWLVQDWLRDNFTPNPPSEEFSWYDHTVPLRLRKLMTIWEFVRRFDALDTEFVDSVLRFVYWHGRILDEDEDLKVHNHNHGLDQADSLFLASAVFSELEQAENWRKNSLPRLQSELENLISAEGVVTENSPSYHVGHAASVFQRLARVAHYTGETLPGRLQSLENEVLKFATIIAQPDGFLPQIGDTQPNVRMRIFLPNLEKLPWYRHYQYVISGGTDGDQPDETRFIYPKTGYYIYRDKWDKPGQNTATQLILKCGFLAEGHRQDDDGNILLYGLGEPWLTDSGIFGYGSDRRRSYVRSYKGHNVTVPEGAETNRDIDQRNIYKDSWGITSYDRETLSSLSCESHMYEAYVYRRNLKILAERSFRVSDTVFSQNGQFKEGIYTQFRIPDDKSIRVYPAEGIVRAIGKAGNTMEILYDSSVVESIDVIRGEDPMGLSIDTAGWRTTTPVKTVRFFGMPEGNTYNVSFVVSLIIGKSESRFG